MTTEFLDLQALQGQRVRVYRNLDYRPARVYSVQIYLRGIGWRLKGHTDSILIEDVAFIVGEDTRKRVVAKKRKLVHAYASGRVTMFMFADKPIRGEAASYDPYVCPTFYTLEDQAPVYRADYCRIDSEGMTLYR